MKRPKGPSVRKPSKPIEKPAVRTPPTENPVQVGATNWQQDATALCLIYHMVEMGRNFPLPLDNDTEFLDPIFTKLCAAGFVEPDDTSQAYRVTDEGLKLRERMNAVFDAAFAFEIFAGVDKDLSLEDDEIHSDEAPNLCRDDIFDPRFLGHRDGEERDARWDSLGRSSEVVDLRVGMMNYVSEMLNDELPKGIDPRTVIFYTHLANGHYDERYRSLSGEETDIWFALRLGVIFKDIEEIAASAYDWRDLDPDDHDWALEQAGLYYTAGMIEKRKREGDVCQECGSPLAMLEYYAQQDGDPPLEECPVCEASLVDEEEAEGPGLFECPNCQATMPGGASACPGCGAEIDWGGVAGSVTRETVTETVTDHDDYGGGAMTGYGYYYDPFDVYVGAAVYGSLCGSMWYGAGYYDPFYYDPYCYW